MYQTNDNYQKRAKALCRARRARLKRLHAQAFAPASVVEPGRRSA